MKLVIGIPAYNEEKNIGKILMMLKPITDTIIVCDDGSSDLTSEIAEKFGAIVVKHQRNLGYGGAIRSIFTKAREISADILVTFDADGQHRVEDIRPVIQPILDKKADIVIGSRFLNNSSQMPKYRKIGIKAITSITSISTQKNITDSQSGFRAYSKDVLDQIEPSEYGMGVSTEILIKSSKKGFKIEEVPIVVLYEGETSTHHPVPHGLSVVLSTLKFISIEHPLKFYGIPGASFLAIGLFFVLWTIQAFTESRHVIASLALIGIGTTILGVLLLLTSILLYSLVNVIREKTNR